MYSNNKSAINTIHKGNHEYLKEKQSIGKTLHTSKKTGILVMNIKNKKINNKFSFIYIHKNKNKLNYIKNYKTKSYFETNKQFHRSCS